MSLRQDPNRLLLVGTWNGEMGRLQTCSWPLKAEICKTCNVLISY